MMLGFFDWAQTNRPSRLVRRGNPRQASNDRFSSLRREDKIHPASPCGGLARYGDGLVRDFHPLPRGIVGIIARFVWLVK